MQRRAIEHVAQRSSGREVADMADRLLDPFVTETLVQLRNHGLKPRHSYLPANEPDETPSALEVRSFG